VRRVLCTLRAARIAKGVAISIPSRSSSGHSGGEPNMAHPHNMVLNEGTRAPVA